MNIVVDASVAIKWFVREPLREEARKLLIGGDELHAPDLLVAELANVAWKKAIRGEITAEHARHIARLERARVAFRFFTGLQPSPIARRSSHLR